MDLPRAIGVALALAVQGCSPGPESMSVDAAPFSETVFAVVSDYSAAGLLSTVRLPSLEVTPNALAGVVSADPVLRTFDGKLYIVNRFGFDNVTIVDAATLQYEAQLSTGNGTNPQDVAVVGDMMYVAALQAPGILVFDLSSDAPANTGRLIDLSMLDPDGTPNCNSIYAIGSKLYVSCQNYDATFTNFDGRIVVVDTVSEEIEAQFPLSYRRPFGLLQRAPLDGALQGDLLITTTEDFEQVGCVERISTGSTPGAAGCLIDNTLLGGYATVFAWVREDLWLAVNTGLTASTLMVRQSDGVLREDSITPPSQQPTDIVRCPSETVVISDRKSGGLQIYSSTGEALNDSPLNLGLPPIFANGLVCL